MKAMKLAVAQRDGLRNIAITLVDPLVSEAGTPSGLRRERSLQAYDGVVNVVGNPNPAISGFPKPSPIRWSKRVSAATSFYAAFRPLFHRLVAGAQVYLRASKAFLRELSHPSPTPTRQR